MISVTRNGSAIRPLGCIPLQIRSILILSDIRDVSIPKLVSSLKGLSSRRLKEKSGKKTDLDPHNRRNGLILSKK
jgi:hypothetical protein